MKRKRIALRDVGVNDEKLSKYNFALAQAYEYFVSAKKSEGLREKTLVSYDEHYRFFVNWLNSVNDYCEIKANELTAIIVRDYINYMQNDHFNFKTKKYGLSDQTTNARLRFLKIFFNFLQEEDLININPVETVKYIKLDERPFKPLDEQEINRLFSIPDKRHYPQFRDWVIMYLLYDSSLRIHEAINLTIDDLDLKSRRIVLPSEKSKGRKVRIIPLSNHTIKVLIELLTENESHFDSKYIFLNWYGEKMAEDTFRRNLKKYVKKAGIDKPFSCHDFRRQSITEMLKNGASLFAVQAIAGHSQIQSTKKYVHFDEETIKNQHQLYSPVVKMRTKFKKR